MKIKYLIAFSRFIRERMPAKLRRSSSRPSRSGKLPLLRHWQVTAGFCVHYLRLSQGPEVHEACWVALPAPGLSGFTWYQRERLVISLGWVRVTYLSPLALLEKVSGRKNLKILKRQVSNRINIQEF